MHGLFDDVRLGVRLLAARRLLAITAIATIAIGIGANAAIFSAVNGLLLDPLPFGDQRELAFPFQVNPRSSFMHYPDARLIDAWQSEVRGAESVQAYLSSDATVLTPEGPRIVREGRASHGLLELLRVTPHLGRDFTSDDERPGAPPVVMLGFGFWRSAFGGDRGVVGRDLEINGIKHTIIGVAPRELVQPLTRDPERDVWRPIPRGADGLYEATALTPVLRRRPDASHEGVAAELTTIARRPALYQDGAPEEWEIRLLRPEDFLAPHIRLSLLLLLGAVGLVLLIACANVANLLLARATERDAELAVRAALGASRARLLRQLLVETLLLGGLGGGLGFLLAHWGFDLIVALRPESLRDLDRVRIDGRVTVFAALMTLVATLAAGLLPALRASRRAISGSLRSGSLAVVGNARARRLGASVIGVEVALALVLLTGAGLLLRTFITLGRQPLGYEPEGLIAVHVDPPSHRYRGEQRRAFHEQLRDAVAALPMVQSAHLVHTVPPMYALNAPDLRIDGAPVDTAALPPFFVANYVDAGYFHALGMRLERGRAMRDGEADVIVVSESFVRRYLAGREPLGQRIRFDDAEPWWTIVGVAEDIPARGLAMVDPVPQLHYSTAATPFGIEMLLLRTDASAATVREAIQTALAGIDPVAPIRTVTSLTDMLDASLDGPRFNLLLLSVLAGMAVVLSTVGLYGVVSVGVNQRIREVGIRRALGESDGSVTRRMLTYGMLPTLLGLGVGLAASLLATRIMESLLFGISPRDPVTFVTVPLFLATVAAVACWFPARRAIRVDPLLALRPE